MFLVYPCLLLDNEIYWSLILSTSYIQSYSNPILLASCKPPDHVMDNYDGQNFSLKLRFHVWTGLDVVMVACVIYPRTLHMSIWLFQFITGVTFRWDYVMCWIVDMLVWIVIWKK